VPKVTKDARVLSVLRVLLVLKVTKVAKVLLEHKVQQALKVLLDLLEVLILRYCLMMVVPLVVMLGLPLIRLEIKLR
jgi:hypothetical protein